MYESPETGPGRVLVEEDEEDHLGPAYQFVKDTNALQFPLC